MLTESFGAWPVPIAFWTVDLRDGGGKHFEGAGFTVYLGRANRLAAQSERHVTALISSRESPASSFTKNQSVSIIFFRNDSSWLTSSNGCSRTVFRRANLP